MQPLYMTCQMISLNRTPINLPTSQTIVQTDFSGLQFLLRGGIRLQTVGGYFIVGPRRVDQNFSLVELDIQN